MQTNLVLIIILIICICLSISIGVYLYMSDSTTPDSASTTPPIVSGSASTTPPIVSGSASTTVSGSTSTTPPIVSGSASATSPDVSMYTYLLNDGTITGDKYCAGNWESKNAVNKNLTCISGINLNNYSTISCGVLGGTGNKLAYQCGKDLPSTCLSTAPGSLCSNNLVSGNYIFNVAMDGNLIMYNGSKTIWSSGVYGKGKAPYNLQMQADGNLVEYDVDHIPIWASGTNGKGTAPFKFVVEANGNAVIYDKTNFIIWTTNTIGK
jgi:hypothetical protein